MSEKSKKMTSKQALTYAIENPGTLPADVVEKFKTMLTALENKSSSPKKPTKAQLERIELANKVYVYMAGEGKPVTATEVMKKFDLGTTQKATGVISYLMDTDKVERVEVKGRAHFQVRPIKTDKADG